MGGHGISFVARTAIVIGSGIGGLSAAIALEKAGVKVEVYERTQELKEVGAGIMLYPNAITALRKLDVYDAVARAGSFGHHGKYVTWDGKVLVELNFENAGLQGESIAIHRANLQDALADHFGRDKIHLGKTLVRYEQNGQMQAKFADGSAAEADFLIGADGLHSAVRKQLVNDGEPRFSNCFAWRGIAHGEFVDLPEESGFIAFGKGLQFGGMAVGQNRYYWFGAVADKRGAQSRTSKKDVLDVFRNWAPPMPQLVEATPEDEILTHDLRDRDPISTWGKGAMTLLGDAAHPMVPFMGQGGCQALEDSIALGAAMKEAPNVEAGLRQYETMRKARTAEFVKQSRKAQSSSMTSSPIVCGLRDFILPKLPVNLLLKTFHTLNSYEQPDL